MSNAISTNAQEAHNNVRRLRIKVDPLNVAIGWNVVNLGGGYLLPAGKYWLGLGAKRAQTVLALRTPAAPVADSLGLYTPPLHIPDLFMREYIVRYAQVPLTLGNWPPVLPEPVTAVFADNGTTGTLPMVFLSSVEYPSAGI